jgi:lysophospholipase L1-like esterase
MRCQFASLLMLVACGGADPQTDSAGDTGATPTTGGPTGGGGEEGPADPHANSYIPAGYGAANPSRIVFLGDSITAGVGASKDSLAYPELLVEDTSNKWSDFADLDLESMYGDVPVVDGSKGGATSGSVMTQQLDDLEGLLGGYPVTGETIVVFTVGGNDMQEALNPFADANEIAQATLFNFGAIVDELQDPAKFPDGVYVYATNVYEPTDGRGQTDGCFLGFDFSADLPVLDQFNDDLRAMAEDKGFSVVDLRGHFGGHGWNHTDSSLPTHDPDDPSVWLDADCIHPNDRGHHEVRRLFHAAIAGIDLPLLLP